MNVIFTFHAEQQCNKRSILKEEVVDAIRYSDKIDKRHGKYYFQKRLDRGVIEASCEKTESNIKVITVYWL